MGTDLAAIRQHLAAGAALLAELDGPPAAEDAFTAGARAGVQIDAEGMAELVEMAARLRLTPAQTLRLALRALAAELARPKHQKVGRLVGAERGQLEGKR